MTNTPNPLDEVRFWSLVGELEKRTIVCSPELESRVKGWIAARGLAGSLTVHVNRFVRDDQVLIVDQEGMRAELNQSMHRASIELRRRASTSWPGRTYYFDPLPPVRGFIPPAAP